MLRLSTGAENRGKAIIRTKKDWPGRGAAVRASKESLIFHGCDATRPKRREPNDQRLSSLFTPSRSGDALQIARDMTRHPWHCLRLSEIAFDCLRSRQSQRSGETATRAVSYSSILVLQRRLPVCLLLLLRSDPTNAGAGNHRDASLQTGAIVRETSPSQSGPQTPQLHISALSLSHDM